MSEIKIGSVIKRYLKLNHLHLKTLSRKTGIPYSTMHTWQENRQPKDILKVQKLAQHMGLTLNELLFDEPSDKRLLMQDKNKVNLYESDDQSNNRLEGTYEVRIRKISS